MQGKVGARGIEHGADRRERMGSRGALLHYVQVFVENIARQAVLTPLAVHHAPDVRQTRRAVIEKVGAEIVAMSRCATARGEGS